MNASGREGRTLRGFALGAAFLLLAYLALGEGFASRAASQAAAGDYVAAARNYRKAASIFRLLGKREKEESALFALASCYSSLGRYRPAAEAAERACALVKQRLGGGSSNPRRLADRLAVLAYYRYRADMLEDAADALSEARELDPQNPRVHYVQGLLLMQAGKLKAALERFDEAVTLGAKREDSFLPNYHLARAEVKVRLERFTEACGDAARALELGLDAPEVHLVYIKSCIYAGKLSEARKASEKAAEEFPGFAVFPCYLGTLDMLAGKYASAAKRFEEVRARGGLQGEDATFSLGVACFCLEKYDDARRYLLAARETDPVLVTVLLYLTALRSGSRDEAERILDSPPFAVSSVRLDFYRDIFRGRYKAKVLSDLLGLRKGGLGSLQAERKALSDLGVPLAPPLSGIPWEEIAFVCGEAALMRDASDEARGFFSAAVDSPHRFYWTYILSLYELRRLGAK